MDGKKLREKNNGEDMIDRQEKGGDAVKGCYLYYHRKMNSIYVLSREVI